jgi:hypothetical protein
MSAPGEMPKIKIGRYTEADQTGYAGWIEPEDRRWILFVKHDGTPVFFPRRDPHTGAILPSVDAPAPEEAR